MSNKRFEDLESGFSIKKENSLAAIVDFSKSKHSHEIAVFAFAGREADIVYLTPWEFDELIYRLTLLKNELQ